MTHFSDHKSSAVIEERRSDDGARVALKVDSEMLPPGHPEESRLEEFCHDSCAGRVLDGGAGDDRSRAGDPGGQEGTIMTGTGPGHRAPLGR
jgi:hypothetical protein